MYVLSLIRREWHEHRSAFLWSAGVVLWLIILAGILMVTFEVDITGDLEFEESADWVEKIGPDGRLEDHEFINEDGETMHPLRTAIAIALDVAGSTDEELKEKVGMVTGALSIPFHWVYVVVAFFALIGCLYDERKDHSVLFWKSMPVSDVATVFSKLAFVIWVAPLVTIAAIFVAQVYALIIGSSFVEEGMSGRLWGASDVWIWPFRFALTYFLQGLWMLPLIGWVMLVSAAVPSAPVLWTFGVPLTLVLLESITSGSDVLASLIGERLTLVIAPMGSPMFGDSSEVLGSLNFWMGLVAGFVMLGLAVFFRQRNNAM